MEKVVRIVFRAEQRICFCETRKSRFLCKTPALGKKIGHVWSLYSTLLKDHTEDPRWRCERKLYVGAKPS